MTTANKKAPPAKLRYKGRQYNRVAITDEGNIWKNKVAPRLKTLFELASDGDAEDHNKKEQARGVWFELKEYFKLLGLQ
jgi:hypothetical protein